MSEFVNITVAQYAMGMVCDAEDYASQMGNSTQVHCLTRGQSIGLTIVTESGFVSLFAVLYVFTIILRNAVRHARATPFSEWRFLRDPMDIFMLSLFSADLLQAVGAVLDIKWLNEGRVQVGSFCTAQGIIQQLGETGVGITTLIIAVYTFLQIRLSSSPKGGAASKGAASMFYAALIICATWVFIIIMVIVGTSVRKPYYMEPTPYWCWIGNHPNNLGFRIAGEYVWFWITLAVSFLLYVTLFLWTRGNVNFDEDSWWKMTVISRHNNTEDLSQRPKPWVMLAYPLVYSIVILPLSIVRWITFSRHDALGEAESAVNMLVISIFSLSGFCNVVLLLNTRPNSGIFGRTRPLPPRGRAPSLAPSHSDVELASMNDSEDLRTPRMPSLFGGSSFADVRQ